MTMKEKINIDDKTKQAIEAVLSKGDRAEVIPVKDGVKVMRVRREMVKTDGREKPINTNLYYT